MSYKDLFKTKIPQKNDTSTDENKDTIVVGPFKSQEKPKADTKKD